MEICTVPCSGHRHLTLATPSLEHPHGGIPKCGLHLPMTGKVPRSQ